MLKLEHGVVNFANHARRYGFLYVLNDEGQLTGEKLFFHLADGQWVDIVEGEIVFAGVDFRNAGEIIFMPVEGELLAFSRREGKGPCMEAGPWTFADGYDNRVEMLATKAYRVIRYVNGSPGRGPIWEGEGADNLTAEYQVRVVRGELVDPLSPDNGYVIQVYVPQNVVSDGHGGQMVIPALWEDCITDPRNHSELVLQLMPQPQLQG